MDESLTPWVEPVALVIEGTGVLIIALAAAVSTALFLLALFQDGASSSAYHAYRANLGRGILLGLEFLVAGDIIATLLIEPTINRVAALGLLVLIRTFLSFSLETEIEGRFPWQRE